MTKHDNKTLMFGVKRSRNGEAGKLWGNGSRDMLQ